MDEMMDEIWYVYISKEEQIKRLMLRDNIDYEYALKKINSQMSMEEKRKIMSKKQNVVLIDNSFDLCYTYESILKLMKEDIEKADSWFDNKGYKWELLNLGNDIMLLEKYQVKIFPDYIILGKDNKIGMAPAPSPDQNLDFHIRRIYNYYHKK